MIVQAKTTSNMRGKAPKMDKGEIQPPRNLWAPDKQGRRQKKMYSYYKIESNYLKWKRKRFVFEYDLYLF